MKRLLLLLSVLTVSFALPQASAFSQTVTTVTAPSPDLTADVKAADTGANTVAVNPGSTVVVTNPTPDSATIDLTSIVAALAIAAWGLLALAAAFVWKTLGKVPFIAKYFTQDQYQKLVDPLLNEAIAYGVGKLENADWLKIETKNTAVATAVNYVMDHGGDLLAKFGITQELLVQKLEAKLVANGYDTKPGEWYKGDDKPKDPETTV